MKKFIFLLTIFAFVFGMVMPVLASELPRPVDKIVKGTTEILKSPVVLIDNTKKEMDKADYIGVGLFKGLLTSPFHMVKQAGGGVIDIATFPIE